MGGPTVAGLIWTFVLRLIDVCPCNSCAKKVQKHLKQIHGIGAIIMDAEEGKVTITGSMVDPYTVISELEKLKKKATLFSEETTIKNIIEEKQIILHKSEFLDGQSEVVVCKPPDNGQVVDKFASSSTPEPDIQSKHEHKLELKNFDKRFICNGCKEDGFRSRYRCEQCDYDLHHDCMSPKLTVSHELFEGSSFEFSDKRPIPTCGDKDCRAQIHMMSCDACGNEIHGYFYHCKAKNLSLHPCCINLKSKLCIQGSTFSLKNKGSSKCFWCNVKNEKGVNSGWSYVSECENMSRNVKITNSM